MFRSCSSSSELLAYPTTWNCLGSSLFASVSRVHQQHVHASHRHTCSFHVLSPPSTCTYPCLWSAHSAGKVFLRARSPLAPKTTTTRLSRCVSSADIASMRDATVENLRRCRLGPTHPINFVPKHRLTPKLLRQGEAKSGLIDVVTSKKMGRGTVELIFDVTLKRGGFERGVFEVNFRFGFVVLSSRETGSSSFRRLVSFGLNRTVKGTHTRIERGERESNRVEKGKTNQCGGDTRGHWSTSCPWMRGRGSACRTHHRCMRETSQERCVTCGARRQGWRQVDRGTMRRYQMHCPQRR